jgi:hypothetical protein
MTKTPLAALALAGVLAIGATTSASAQWRHHHNHGWGPVAGVAAGVAAGALIGSAVAARPYGGYYTEPSYGYYEAPVAGYEYAPTYVAPTYGYGWGRYNCGGSYGQSRDCSAGDTGR